MELMITSPATIFDLLLGIGLILLGLSCLAVMATVEIYHFRNPKHIKEYYRKEREKKHGKTVCTAAR